MDYDALAKQYGGTPNYDELAKNAGGSVVGEATPTPTPEQRGGLGSAILRGLKDAGTFVAKDVLGAGTPQKSESFLGGLFQNTIGSHGLAGVAQLPGRTIGAALLHPDIQALNDSQNGLANVTYQLYKHAQILPDSDPRKAQLMARVQDNQGYLDQTRQQGDELGKFDVTPGQALGTTLNAAATVIPTGSVGAGITGGARALGMETGVSALGKVGAGALTGYIGDVGNKFSEGKATGEALIPGWGTAFGAAIPAAGVAKNMATRWASGESSRVVNSLVKPLLKDFSFGKDPGRGVAEAGIKVNSFDQLEPAIAKARQQTGQNISQVANKLDSRATVYLGGALDPIDEAMKNAAASNDQSLIFRLQRVKDALTKNLGLGEGNVIASSGTKDWFKTGNASFSDAFAVKKQIGDLTKWTGNPSEDNAVNAALKQTYGTVKEQMFKSARKVDPSAAAALGKLNERYADLTSAQVAVKYRSLLDQRKNLISLGQGVSGIAGALLGAIVSGGAAIPAILGGASVVAVEKALASTAVKTRVATALAHLPPDGRSRLLQKLSPGVRSVIENVMIAGGRQMTK